MRKIVVAECKQEVSTFNPVCSRYGDFAIAHDAEIEAYHRLRKSEIGGAMSVFREHSDLQVEYAYEARQITSGGRLDYGDFRRISREFLASISSLLPANGIFLSMHGAMAAVGEDDPEGFLIQETRRLVGNDIPIVVSLDLHAVLTDRMLTYADAVVMLHTYPHVDFFETGVRAGRLLVRLVNRKVRPTTAKVYIPTLVRGNELLTETGIYGRLIMEAQAIEREPTGLVSGIIIGNPFTDVPELGCYAVVTTDNNPALACRQAGHLAQHFWDARGRMQAELTPLEESVRVAAASAGTIALIDAADAPSSGASGDSNAILCELFRTGYSRRALIPIVDAPAVSAAFQAGVAGTVLTSVGGTLDRSRFRPLAISGTVRLLSDGRFLSEAFADEWNSGQTAVIDVGTITLVVTSRPVHLFDRALFYAHGRDPKRYDLVVVKSPNPQRRMYRDWCSKVIYVDAAGSTSAALARLPFSRCPRPIFPLDPETPFRPEPKVFQMR